MVSITMLSCNSSDCSNGIQDGNETGVDCGGNCIACPTTPSLTPQHTALLGLWTYYSSDNQGLMTYYTDVDCKVEFTDQTYGGGGTHYTCYGAAGFYNCT